MNFGFIIDNRKCIGCHACTVACKSEHDVPIGVNRTWVKYIEKGEFPDTRRLFSVMRCNHCADAPCVEICPTEALYTRADGIVDFDDRRCISCKACTQACPYDSIYINPDTMVAQKCNYCSHRTDIGLEPACVVVCPEHAIISGDMDNPLTEISQLLARETVSVRKAEKGTNPKLFYIDGDKDSLNPTETNQSADYMWSSQAAGVGKYAKYAEQRINESPNKEELAKQKKTNFVQIEPRAKNRKKEARRVYDAPSKGILVGLGSFGIYFDQSDCGGRVFASGCRRLFYGNASARQTDRRDCFAYFPNDHGHFADYGFGQTGQIFVCSVSPAMEIVAVARLVYHHGLRRNFNSVACGFVFRI